MVTLLIGVVLGVIAGAAALWLLTGRATRRRTPEPPLDPARRRAELVSKIAHELKNPVMTVKGLASTGSRLYDSLPDEDRRDLFRLIDVEAGRLKLLAEETSTALKIDAGTLSYDRRDEDVGDIVERAAWRTPVGDHPMSVTVERGLAAAVDAARIAEVVTSLVDNASKFSPSDAPIEVRAERAPDGIVIDVADVGPGVPAGLRGAVFERYATWRPAGFEEVPGPGLGLYISRAHVEAHGGRLHMMDARPRGTILRVWLPSEGVKR